MYPTYERELLLQRLARIAQVMAIANGLLSLVLVPAGIVGAWMSFQEALNGEFVASVSRVSDLAIGIGYVALVGVGVWLWTGYARVAWMHSRPRAFWLASLAYNAVGAAVMGWSLWTGAFGLFSLAFAPWSATMAVLSLQAARLTDAAAKTGEPLA